MSIRTSCMGYTAFMAMIACAPASDSYVAFGRIDAAVILDANAQLLAQDYDSGSIEMYKALASSGQNFIFSGYSINTVMGMMYAGAAGSTVGDLATALRWRLSPQQLPIAHNTLNTVIATAAGNSNATLQTGTRTWFANGEIKLLPSYNETLLAYYGTAAQGLDFSNPKNTSAAINAWVAAQTKGLIPQLLTPQQVQDTTLVQTAALYFKAPWSTALQRDTQADTAFTTALGVSTPTVMLRNADYYLYAETATYQAIDIPYGQGALAFLLVLPKGDLDSFEAALDGPFVHTVSAALKSTYVQLALPPLTLNVPIDLSQTLRALGVSIAFSSAANFSGTGVPGLQLQAVLGQTVLKLDENGTEAAAATAATFESIDAQLPPSDAVVLTANHPFFFAIHDTHAQVPLFMGRVGAP